MKVDSTRWTIVHEEIIVNLCNMHRVENTQGGEHVMILDPGASKSLIGRPWLSKYLAEFDYKIEDMVSSECYQIFIFGGIDKKHECRLLLESPFIVTSTKGKDDALKTYVYVIKLDVTFLVGRKMKIGAQNLILGEMYWRLR